MKLILTDIDDSCLGWNSRFLEYVERVTGKRVSNIRDDWHLAESLGMSIHETGQMVDEFNRQWEFGTLSEMLNSQVVISNMVKLGFRFVAITSCSTHPTTVALRKVNIHYVFGNSFDEIHCLDWNTKKSDALKEYQGRATFWVEDKYENALMCLEYGMTPIMIRRSYNRKQEETTDSRVIWVDDWDQIQEIVLKEHDVVWESNAPMAQNNAGNPNCATTSNCEGV